MKRLLIALIVASVIGATAQSSTDSRRSPRDDVDQFVKMDVEGARLTAEGWSQADALFVKRSEPPHPKFLRVIARQYAISESTEKAGTNEFYMGYEEIGRVDTASLRFVPSNSGIETRSFDKYHVVTSHVSHAPEAASETPHERNTSSEWRIDGTQPPTMHLTAAAIRYVTEMRVETTDPRIRKNADITIKQLSPYR